ncbi:MAG: aspartate 1-decarboxylase [Thermoanaerobaculia bacterium]
MMRRLIRAAIRNATVTRGEGQSLRIDPVILRAADILPLEEVEVVYHATGNRALAFAENGEEGSGEIVVPHARAGDAVSILSWGLLHDGQTLAHRAKLVTLDASNRIVALTET